MVWIRKTGWNPPHPRLSLCVLVILATLASAAHHCAHFSFPSFLHNGRLFCKEHTTMKIPFFLNIDNCLKEEDKSHFVYVSQMTSKSSSDVEFCAIRLTHEVCFSYKPQNCRCGEEHGRWQVVFEKLMRQSDNGPWLWQTGDGLTETIDFDVQPDTSRTDDAISPAEALEVKLAKKKIASAAADSQDRPYGSRGSERGHIHTSSNKEQKSPARISPIHTEQLSNDKKDANPVRDGNRVTDDDDDDDDDDDNDDDSFSNTLMTGVVVGTLNVISIVVVLVIVLVCRKRKERRAMGSPDSKPPSPPVWRDSFVSTRTSQSGVYDEIPAAGPCFQNETYLVPGVLRRGCEGNTYTSLA